jgi:energy-coupling factor transport system ATP-binding protein
MALTVENICVMDPAGKKKLLDGINLTLEEGSLTLLLGATGAGKSTLLDALSGLQPLADGSIHYDGLPLWTGKRLNPEASSRFGNVFQHPETYLFARTVRKEFEFSLKFLKLPYREIESRARKAMDRVGLPLSMMNRPPLFLSGGEKRRVALATALSVEPRWLLLDEPSAGMDPPAVHQLVRDLAEWKSVSRGSAIVATHQIGEFLPVADRFLFLRDGRLIADVDLEELIRTPRLWEEARLRMPDCLALAERLKGMGADVPSRLLQPRELAGIILRGRPAGADSAEAEKTAMMSSADVPSADGGSAHLSAATREGTERHETQPESGLLVSLDPRVKWLVYVLFSFAVLMQNDWWGLMAGAATAATWHLLSGLKARRVLLWCMPFALFTSVSVVVAGVTIDPGQGGNGPGIGFSTDAAMLVLFRMGKIGAAMYVGILFALTTSFYRMKLGLEQSLEGLRRFRLPVGEFALTAALMIRFVPLLQQELNKFARIVRARGKDFRSGALRLRHVPALMIPMMLSLLQWANDLTMALTARGAGRMLGHQKIRSSRLRMQKSDVAALLAGVGWVLLLAAWRLLDPV